MVKHSGMSQCTVLHTHWEHFVLKGYSSSIPSQAVIPFPHFMELARKPCGECGEAQMFSKHFMKLSDSPSQITNEDIETMRTLNCCSVLQAYISIDQLKTGLKDTIRMWDAA